MTGEITLTGQVLPIGGLKEKSLAAQRAGVTHIIAPKLNEADLDDFPESLLAGVKFSFVERIDQVLEQALEPPKSRTSRPSRPRAIASGRAAARGR
jgi:ATP-dependent Lon protease